MKILMMFHQRPFPPDYGAAKRNYHLLVETAKNHTIAVLSNGTPEDERRFREHFGRTFAHVRFVDVQRNKWVSILRRIVYLLQGKSDVWAFYSPDFQQALDEMTSAEQFDLLFSSFSILGFYRFPRNIPRIGNTHNVEYDNLRRASRETRSVVRKVFYFLQSLAVRRDEIRTARQFDVLLATSERDRRLFQEDLPEVRIEVIPNGVDLEDFSVQTVATEPHTMVFTGIMNYYPNDHGVRYFLEEIFPLIQARVPDAQVSIVGGSPSRAVKSYASASVHVTGYVKEIPPYLARAEVAIIPLLIGGGTRLKALEAMAMKKPIVSTTLGCEGLDLFDGESVLFGDTPQAFADAVVRLFLDPALRERISSRAHAQARAYRWEAISEKLEELFRQLRAASTDHIVRS